MSDNKKIRSISEGYFHSVQASNKAEKFKLSKLSQGIESCRQAQFRNFRKEEKDLLNTLLKLTKQKISKQPDAESELLDFVNGDFDGYPKTNGPIPTSLQHGPRLKLCLPKEEDSSPFEIIPEPYKECIKEEDDHDVPLHRLQSELDATVKRKVTKLRNAGKTSTGSFGNVLSCSSVNDTNLHGRRESTTTHITPSIYCIERGETGQRVALARTKRRGSLPQHLDSNALISLQDRVEGNSTTGLNPIFPSNATGGSSNTSCKDHQSNMIPSELKSRRFSLLDIEETVPFYLLRKYNHYHTNETPKEYFFNRFSHRRNALTALDRNDFETFRAKSRGSADLGTVSLKKNEGKEKSKKGIDQWTELKEKYSSGGSDLRNGSQQDNWGNETITLQNSALKIFPKVCGTEDDSEHKTCHPSKSDGPLATENLNAHDMHIPCLDKHSADNSEKNTRASLTPPKVPYQRARSNSLPVSLLGSAMHKTRLLLVPNMEGPRTGRKGSLPLNLRKIQTMPDLAKIKSLKEIDNATELVDFDDADVVFPANDPTNSKNYTLKEYRALRKCRYLRLSRLNWESLQWQLKNEGMRELED